jgi:lysophospholipase L1-like esterase
VTAAAPPAAAARPRRWWARAALGAAGALGAVLVLEAFLQVVDPGRYGELEARERLSEQILVRGGDGVLRLRPGARASYLGHAIAIGAHGLRNAEVAVPKPADVYRIVVLGDSVPFGWGVGEQEAFPRLVEQALHGLPRSDGRRYEVVNAGVPGFGLVEEYLWLRDHGLAWAPDLVLHCVIANDIEPLPGKPPFVLPPALRRIRTLRLLERLGEQLAGGRAEPGTGLTPEQLAFALDRFVELCHGPGVRYVLLDTVAVPAVIAHCQAKGIARLDCPVTPAWIDAHRVLRNDFHPGAAGHRWLADRVMAGLPALLGR